MKVLAYVFFIETTSGLFYIICKLSCQPAFIASAHKLQIFDNISIAIQQSAYLVDHTATTAWLLPLNIFTSILFSSLN